MVEKLHSTFTFRSLPHLYWEAPSPSQMRPAQYLSPSETYRYPADLSVKQNRGWLSVVRLPLLKALNCMMIHNVEKYLVPCLHVYFAKKKYTALLNGKLNRVKLQKMTEMTHSYASDAPFPCSAAFIHRFLGFMERCDLDSMIVLYTEVVRKLYLRHKNEAVPQGELAWLRPDNRELNSVNENTFAPQCSSDLFAMKFHYADHAVDNVNRFRTFSLMKATLFVHFSVCMSKY